MPIVWSPLVDSLNDVVYNRKVDSQLVVKLHYALLGLLASSTTEGRNSVRGY